MLQQITFLEGHKHLAKRFTPAGVESYPLAKKITSYTYPLQETAQGLRDKTALLQTHASKGHALLKGALKRPLVNESRSGLTDSEAHTQNILIDIDGFKLRGETLPETITKDDIARVAAACVEALPEAFHNVSYIVHASSSLGLNADRSVVSMHLDFMLSTPIAPDLLKRWLQYMNFTLPVFEQQLSLTSTGTALRYKLDVSLGDNSRIVYVAPPIFDGVTDPIPNHEDRIFLVECNNLTVTPPNGEKELSQRNITKLVQEKIAGLRDLYGWGEKKALSAFMRIGGENLEVVLNPDGATITEVSDEGKYVRYNVGTGDSNGYFVHKLNPQVIRNFKGEPNFLFEKADANAYAAHIAKYIQTNPDAAANFTPEPIGFRDEITDTYYNGMVNRATGTVIKLMKTHMLGVAQYFAHAEYPEPEVMPVYRYEFDPTDHRTVDLPNNFINRYTPSDLMRYPVEISHEYIGIDYESVFKLEQLCPNIFKLLRSVTGGGETEIQHFINWFAFIVCERKKTQTAWVFHGTEGTGKGVLMERIIKPILGEQYAIQIRVENLDEQFNAWMETALVVMIDEFKFTSAKNKEALLEKLRNYITEPTTSIRGMRSDTRAVRNFANFIIGGNERDMLRPSEGDRRYNVCPRQEVKLRHSHAELTENLELIDKEVPAFAAALLNFKVYERAVRTPLDNDAKKLLREASRTVVEDFFASLRSGDLDFFAQILDMDDNTDPTSLLPAAKNAVRGMLSRLEVNNGLKVSSEHLHFMFQVLMGHTKGSLQMFSKMLAREGMAPVRVRIGEKTLRGLHIGFKAEDIEMLRQTYLVNFPNNVAQFPGAAREQADV